MVLPMFTIAAFIAKPIGCVFLCIEVGVLHQKFKYLIDENDNYLLA